MAEAKIPYTHNSVGRIKRAAKKLVRTQGIKYSWALDQIVQGLGYRNWQHFLTSIQIN